MFALLIWLIGLCALLFGGSPTADGFAAVPKIWGAPAWPVNDPDWPETFNGPKGP